MRLLSRFTRRDLAIAAAFVAAVLVLGGMASVLSRSAGPSATNDPPVASGEPVVRPVFSIARIDGIDDVLASVQRGATVPDEPRSVRAAVLPHHTLAAEKLMELWAEIATGSDPSVIVLVGPNHENAGEGMVQTTKGVWATPFGAVSTDDSLVDRLVSLGIATEEPASFVNEHSVGTHVSFLAKLFPGIPIVPVVAKSPAGESDAASLAIVLQQILPDDALVISSVDFCHFLPQDRTDDMDAETLALAAGRKYEEIERLRSDHLDSPYAFMAYLLWNDRNGWTADLAWHSSSHRIQGQPGSPGTSYLVFSSTADRDATTISFAGDIILGRGVENALGRVDIGTAFESAALVLAGSDLAFANLESVLTVSDVDTGKEIFFKADPARADVLRLLGLTHVSVVNNHVDDYGYAGWQESVGHLHDAGIVPVGDYDGGGQPVVATTNGGSVVFLAYDDTYRPIDVETLGSEVANAGALGDTLVVSFHWGVEYQHAPTQRQRDLARAAIDAGAELVVGHHPHVLQGIETYDGGLILYSLGNFMFDQDGEDENESLVARVTLADDGSRALELVPMRIVGGIPRMATAEERAATLARAAEWSDPVLFENIQKGEIIDW